jgi:hypothetical protein
MSGTSVVELQHLCVAELKAKGMGPLQPFLHPLAQNIMNLVRFLESTSILMMQLPEMIKEVADCQYLYLISIVMSV